MPASGEVVPIVSERMPVGRIASDLFGRMLTSAGQGMAGTPGQRFFAPRIRTPKGSSRTSSDVKPSFLALNLSTMRGRFDTH